MKEEFRMIKTANLSKLAATLLATLGDTYTAKLVRFSH